ncbi:FAD-dependent oxidoreductase [Flavobacterium suaedae]|uniref:FAD-dependent oxidoreductase n=1 Tax=Flavobacterium suaedae TaxID=1767027 RepID=A0ABQ1JP34_9FLAO|nr:FAD-binding oxidoreductase [Flavobacterium suaedae]GGB71149.1 FAD-dependent oxidoreductase [Flavobacterium suaedae]
MKDFIIVGAGIAGVSFAETCLLNGKTFTVIADNSQNSSRVAAGVYNPVILKRFRPPADAEKHLNYIKPFYKTMEERLNVQFMHEVPVYRKFASVEEQNMWFEAADKPLLEPFLNTTIQHKKYNGVSSPFGFGKVNHTGYMDTNHFLDSYRDFLKSENLFLEESFDYDALKVEDDRVTYKDITAKHIVFAEGYGIKSNPFFKDLPLNGTKGEVLVIKASELDIDVIIKSGVFVLPIGDNIYKIGATYEWEDKTTIPTQKGREELEQKLQEIITCDYEVIDQLAGIRPTVKDRKSLVGTHAAYTNVHLLNGLGTRGVLLGPPMAALLYDAVINGNEVPKEVNLNRFTS